jgi:hypothetical protein
MQTQVEETNTEHEAAKAEWRIYWQAMNLALQLSPERRHLLAKALNYGLGDYEEDSIESEVYSDEPLKFDILAYLSERPSTNGPGPTDQEIEEWIEEYHTHRYR